MTSYRINEIIIDNEIQIRAQLDHGKIEDYMECFDALPPVDLFQVAAGPLLADGFHRIESAKRLRKTEIEAVMHKGGWDEARAFAITSNAHHGMPLTRAERNEGIKRLLDLGWTTRKIADEFGVAHSTVVNIDQGRKLRAELPAETAEALGDTQLYRIATVDDQDQRLGLAKIAAEEHWTEPEVRAGAKTLSDPEAAPEVKTGILAGTIPPIFREGGRVMIPEDTIQRETEAALRRDASHAVNEFCLAARHLASFTPDQVVAALDSKLWPVTVAQFEATVRTLPVLIERLSVKVVS